MTTVSSAFTQSRESIFDRRIDGVLYQIKTNTTLAAAKQVRVCPDCKESKDTHLELITVSDVTALNEAYNPVSVVAADSDIFHSIARKITQEHRPRHICVECHRAHCDQRSFE